MPENLPREFGVGGLAPRAAGLVVVVLAVALPISTLPGLGEVRERFSTVEPIRLATMVVLELGSCLSYVVAFRRLCARLGWRFS